MQPYIAAGFGTYFNNIDNMAGLFDNSKNYTMENSYGMGFGVVGKVGIRFFITEKFFLGEYFTNWQEMKAYPIGYGYGEQDKTLNLGGAITNFELGLKF
ncbi:MAG: hypothetical protein ABSB79_04300 [Syntrophales bacterium]